jgi:UPF0271 protein
MHSPPVATASVMIEGIEMDLNCDVGEVSFAHDSVLLPFFTSCNVSCGAHAGELSEIQKTIEHAIQSNIAVGAHPSYPDRANFGRMSMQLPHDELQQHVETQIQFVLECVESAGGQLRHIKAHGALYHDVCHDLPKAQWWAELIRSLAPASAVVGMSGSLLHGVCEQLGLSFRHEAFGDRMYQNASTLTPREDESALITDPIKFRNHLSGLLRGVVRDQTGQWHSLRVDTICLHGDTPSAVELAALARQIMRGRNG